MGHPDGTSLMMSFPEHPVWRTGPAWLLGLDHDPHFATRWAVRHGNRTWTYQMTRPVPAAEIWQVHVGDALCHLCAPRRPGMLTPGDERRLAWRARQLLLPPGARTRLCVRWSHFLDFRSVPAEAGGLFGPGLVAAGQVLQEGRPIAVVTGDGPQAVDDRSLPGPWVLLQQLGRWWLGRNPDASRLAG